MLLVNPRSGRPCQRAHPAPPTAPSATLGTGVSVRTRLSAPSNIYAPLARKAPTRQKTAPTLCQTAFFAVLLHHLGKATGRSDDSTLAHKISKVGITAYTDQMLRSYCRLVCLGLHVLLLSMFNAELSLFFCCLMLFGCCGLLLIHRLSFSL